MGMLIDGQIKGLEYLKKCGIFPFSDTRTGIVFDDECIDGAISTMHKYQKIVEIVKNTDAMTGSNGYACAFIDIREVVKDGNDNN